MPDNGRWKSDSWLAQQVERLEALYQRFGTAGLKECDDAHLLLWSKQMQLRDGFQGADRDDALVAQKQRLELEVKDLTGYLQARRQEKKPAAERQPRMRR